MSSSLSRSGPPTRRSNSSCSKPNPRVATEMESYRLIPVYANLSKSQARSPTDWDGQKPRNVSRFRLHRRQIFVGAAENGGGEFGIGDDARERDRTDHCRDGDQGSRL